MLDVLGDPSADNNLLRRDAVFALLNFNLQGGSIKLCTSHTNGYTHPAVPPTHIPNTRTPSHHLDPGSSPPGDPGGGVETITELEFTGVKMSFEWRMRTSSYLFSAKLGALFVHDVMTKGSLFPHLIAPQQKRVS